MYQVIDNECISTVFDPYSDAYLIYMTCVSKLIVMDM